MIRTVRENRNLIAKIVCEAYWLKKWNQFLDRVNFKLKLNLNSFKIRRNIVIKFNKWIILTYWLIECNLYPVGSSVNGFGSHGCDLDACFILRDQQKVISHGFKNEVYFWKLRTFQKKLQSICWKDSKLLSIVLVCLYIYLYNI